MKNIQPKSDLHKRPRPSLTQVDDSTLVEQARYWLWSTCLHEAGHTIAALAVAIPFERVPVSAMPDGSFLHTEMDASRPLASAIVLYAGHAALATHYGWITMSDSDAYRFGAAKDYQYARGLLTRRGLFDIFAQARAQDAALKIVEQRRAAIRRLAAALVQRGELDTKAVTMVVRHRCSQPLPQWSTK